MKLCTLNEAETYTLKGKARDAHILDLRDLESFEPSIVAASSDQCEITYSNTDMAEIDDL